LKNQPSLHINIFANKTMGVLSTLAGVIALASVFVPEVAAQSCQGVSGRYSPKMGSGYRHSVLATGLRQPRHIVVDSAGNLLVAEGGSQGVRRLVLQDQGNIVCVQSNTQIVSGSVSRLGFLAGRILTLAA
jgi:hypothetical protein